MKVVGGDGRISFLIDKNTLKWRFRTLFLVG